MIDVEDAKRKDRNQVPLKMFVWYKDIFRDWSSGLAVAIAEDVDQARKLIAKDHGGDYNLEDECDDCMGLKADPDEIREIDAPSAVTIHGGS